MSNFWRSIDLPLINCEIELDLIWTRSCIISEISRTSIVIGNPTAREVATETTAATFQINNAKLYVPILNFSINDNIKFLKNIKQGFKTTISWNKYRSEITTQTKKSNLGLFVLSFKNGNNDPTIIFFDKYYMSLVEIKDFNALMNNQQFFDQSKKSKQEAYEKLNEMSKKW